jgi:hypothetical protein
MQVAQLNLHITHTPYRTFEGYKRWNLHLFWISPMHLKINFYMSYIQWGIHHMCPQTSLHKDHSIKTCTFTCVKTFIIKMTHQFIATYVHYTKNWISKLNTNNMKSLKGKYEFKVPSTTLYIFEKNNRWIINPIYLHL